MIHVYPCTIAAPRPAPPRPALADRVISGLDVGMYHVALCGDLPPELCALCEIDACLPRYVLGTADRPIVIHGSYGRS